MCIHKIISIVTLCPFLFPCSLLSFPSCQISLIVWQFSACDQSHYVVISGVGANFNDFASAFQTIFQLMFGEDMPMMWDDCYIQSPECTQEDIVDVDGKVSDLNVCTYNQ